MLRIQKNALPTLCLLLFLAACKSKSAVEPSIYFVAYPNPATYSIDILLNKAVGQQGYVHVFDGEGSTLQKTEITGLQTGLNQLTVDISTIEPGFFYVALDSDKGTVTRKMLKQ